MRSFEHRKSLRRHTDHDALVHGLFFRHTSSVEVISFMLYSVVQGESSEEIAKAFEGHPHLEIPGAWIDISTANYLPGMEA